MDISVSELSAPVQSANESQHENSRQGKQRMAGLSNIYQVFGIAEQEDMPSENSCHYRVVRSGVAIFGLGDHVSNIYFVVSGTVKTAFEHEGELFISEFATTGDILGLDGVDNLTHANTCIALSDVALLCLPYPTFIFYSQKYERFNSAVMKKIGERINRKKMFVEVMARANAETKVAFLLTYLSIKSGSANRPAEVIDLGISRIDIASHLGLAYETVVRTLGNLRSNRIISLQGRAIRIEKPIALQQLCSGYIRGL